MGDSWDYARQLGKSLSQICPKDHVMRFDDGLFVSATIRTMHEAEALCTAIMHIGPHWLSWSRPMVAGDIGVEPPPAPSTFKADLERMFGFEAITKEVEG